MKYLKTKPMAVKKLDDLNISEAVLAIHAELAEADTKKNELTAKYKQLGP